jgi:hypothetical protein
MAFAAPETDLAAPAQGFQAPESDLTPVQGFSAPQADIETHAKGLLAQPDYDPAAHAAQLDPNDPDIESHYQAYKQKQNAPMGTKVWDAVKTAFAPSTAIEAAKGVGKFVTGLGGVALHSAVGQAENYGARIASAVGDDKVAEDLAQRATTNKAESVIGGQMAEKSITGTVEHIAGPVRRALQEGVNADTGYSADRQDQLLRDKFATAVQEARDAQQLQSGRPLDTGVVAWLARKSEGEEPSAAFGPERLESMGARPVSPFVTGMIGATADPNNLILSQAGTFPGANKIAGTALRGVGAAGEAGARMTADAIRSAAKSRLAKLAAKTVVAASAFHPMAAVASVIPGIKAAAVAGGTWAGAKLAQAGFGAMKEAGGEMLGAAPLPGQGFFRSVLKEGLKGGTSTAVGMVPINALESQGDPSEFARGEINAGVFGGALGAASGAKNARSLATRGYYAQTVKAGEATNYHDPADAAHHAVMQNLPQPARDVINFARGQFDGATTPDGKPIRVQAVDDATFRQQTGQSSRGVYFNDGTLIINAGHTARDGTFYPKSAEALNQTIAHEGKHAIDQAHAAAQPELYKTVFDSLKNHFTTDGTNPTPEFAQWIQGQLQLHAENLRQAGATPEQIQAQLGKIGDTQYWLNEASADIGQGLVTGTDLGAFMLPQSLSGKVWDALKDAAAKNGINLPQNTAQGALGAPQAAQAARAIRRQLYAAGAEARTRIETPDPKAAETTPAPAPQAPPSPVSPGNAPVTTAAPASPLNRFRIAAILRRNGINAAEATHWANQAEGISDEHAVIDALKKRAEAKFGTPKTEPLSPASEANSNTATAQKAPFAGEPISKVSDESGSRPSMPSPVTSEAGEVVSGGATSLLTKTNEIPASPQTNQPLPAGENIRTPEQPSPNATPPGVRESSPAVPDETAITTALQNAESNTIQSPAYAKKRGGKTQTKEQSQAEMVKAARIAALYELLPPDGPGLHRVTDPDTLELSYEGKIDPQNPLHQAILVESGLSPAHVAVLESAQGRIGKGTYLLDYNSAAQELGPAGETEQSAQQRNTEYKQSATSPEKGRRQGGVSKQDKAVTILGVKGTKTGVNLVTLDHDKFFDNARKILDAAQPLNPEHPIYAADPKQAGKLLAQAFQTIAENNANGWKSRGDAPQKSFPDNPVKVTPGYEGKPVDRFLANVINMALHNRSAKNPVRGIASEAAPIPETKKPRNATQQAAAEEAYQKRVAERTERQAELDAEFGLKSGKAKEIAGLADINNRPLMEDGESNFLRATLERRGFETDKQIKPVISNIRPDLIEGGIADAPSHGRVVHEHGFDVPAGELTIRGRPADKPIAGNFMPEDLTKNQVGASNLNADTEKNIRDAKMMNPSDPASFLRKMAAAARAQGKTEPADNFEAAAKQVVQESAKERFMPDTGKPGESEDKRENLTREAEQAGVVLSVDTLKGLMAEDPETMRKVRARIEQETGKPARFMPEPKERIILVPNTFQGGTDSAEVIRNPSLRELREIEKTGSPAAILTNENAWVWNRDKAFHSQVQNKIGNGLSIMIYGATTPQPEVFVTDASKRSEFWHSPRASKLIRNHPFFKGKDPQISYYDESENGDWADMREELGFMPESSNLTKNQVARPDYRAAARARIQKRERELVH